MSNEVNVPQLRFPEFKDDWNLIKLEDNAIIKGRIGWKNLKSEEYTDVGPSLIAGKHIHNGIINWDECDHITIERYDESPEIALQNGDVIFSKDGSLGNPALIKDLKVKATINGTMMLVRLDENKINPNYFYQILNSDYFFRLLHILKSGSSILHIFQRYMVNFKFPLCPLEEQKKISNFLELIDKKIGLLNNKFNFYLKYKNSIINEIFTHSEDWNQFYLGDLVEFLNNQRVPLNKESRDKMENKYPYYGAFGIIDYVDDYLFDEDLILLGEDGTIKPTIARGKYWVSNHAHVLKCKIDINQYFLFTVLSKINFMKYNTGTIQPKLNKKTCELIKIKIPSKKEQDDFGNFLKSVDKKIDLVCHEKEQLNLFKLGLLQKMFI